MFPPQLAPSGPGWDLVSLHMQTWASSLQLIREQLRAVNVPYTDTLNPKQGVSFGDTKARTQGPHFMINVKNQHQTAAAAGDESARTLFEEKDAIQNF